MEYSEQVRSKGKVLLLYCPNKISTPFIGLFDTSKIAKNEIKLRKLQPPKVKGVKN
jgi:hypothetical protein